VQSGLVVEYLLEGASQGGTEQGESAYPSDEFADYVLLGRDNKPLAIVEAKRSSRDALAGKRQAADCADRLLVQHNFDPFIFLANGETTWFWDRVVSAPYQVSGFFTQSDLERLLFLRQYRSSLDKLNSDFKIVDRAYQQQAIKQITQALEQGQRHFLLVTDVTQREAASLA
jgi:type I restriction enzyme R subunit